MEYISEIQQAVIDGFKDWHLFGDIVVKERDDLRLFNYTHEAQYKANWTFLERVSRGLIIRTDGEIVARPFDKFFNWFEGGRVSQGHIVSITEKMDGSLGILYRHQGQYQIATRGSFDGEQAMWATKFLNDNYDLSNLPDEYTLLFEIIYPENQIVIDYGGTTDLVLLAVRNRYTGQYLSLWETNVLAHQFGLSQPATYNFNNVTDILEATGRIQNIEGWVVEFSDGQRFKFKADRYLELHRFISHITYKKVLALLEEDTYTEYEKSVPEEYLEMVRGWKKEIENQVLLYQIQINKALKDMPQSKRKEQAAWIYANYKDCAEFIFLALDGKDTRKAIFKRLSS